MSIGAFTREDALGAVIKAVQSGDYRLTKYGWQASCCCVARQAAGFNFRSKTVTHVQNAKNTACPPRAQLLADPLFFIDLEPENDRRDRVWQEAARHTAPPSAKTGVARPYIGVVCIRAIRERHTICARPPNPERKRASCAS
jgi:hypothetical protein